MKLSLSRRINTFEDFLEEREKRDISRLEEKAKVKCPVLRNIGKFYYCLYGLSEQEEKEAREAQISLSNVGDNKIYRRHTSWARLRLWCMSNNTENPPYKICKIFQGKLSPLGN